MSASQRPRRGVHAGRAQRVVEEATEKVEIVSIAAGGNGVGRINGMACFVPRTAPGDRVQVALRRRGRFATGRLLQVLEPSTTRVAPQCVHYTKDRCGGCQLQHMEGDAQRAARATIVKDALQRIGRRDVKTPQVVAGPSDWEYRRRITLTLQQRGNRWVGGLHPWDDAARVFDLHVCPITRPELVRVWNASRSHLHLLPDIASLRLALRLLDDGQVAVVVIGARSWPQSPAFGDALLDADAGVREVWWENESGKVEQVVSRQNTMVDSNSVSGDPPADDDSLAFVQVNSAVASILRRHVVDRIFAFAPLHVLDAYAGSGLLTEQIARAGVAVTSVEMDRHAVARAQQRTRGLANVFIRRGGVETLVPEALASRPDVVVVNPPRRGLEPGLEQHLNDAFKQGVRAIVYISCDPATLSRDTAALTQWRISDLKCFDMFPQTAHVETVCVLEPENR